MDRNINVVVKKVAEVLKDLSPDGLTWENLLRTMTELALVVQSPRKHGIQTNETVVIKGDPASKEGYVNQVPTLVLCLSLTRCQLTSLPS